MPLQDEARHRCQRGGADWWRRARRAAMRWWRTGLPVGGASRSTCRTTPCTWGTGTSRACRTRPGGGGRNQRGGGERQGRGSVSEVVTARKRGMHPPHPRPPGACDAYLQGAMEVNGVLLKQIRRRQVSTPCRLSGSRTGDATQGPPTTASPHDAAPGEPSVPPNHQMALLFPCSSTPGTSSSKRR